MMEVIKIDEKWSIAFDLNNNMPFMVLRYGKRNAAATTTIGYNFVAALACQWRDYVMVCKELTDNTKEGE